MWSYSSKGFANDRALVGTSSSRFIASLAPVLATSAQASPSGMGLFPDYKFKLANVHIASVVIKHGFLTFRPWSLPDTCLVRCQ